MIRHRVTQSWAVVDSTIRFIVEQVEVDTLKKKSKSVCQQTLMTRRLATYFRSKAVKPADDSCCCFSIGELDEDLDRSLRRTGLRHEGVDLCLLAEEIVHSLHDLDRSLFASWSNDNHEVNLSFSLQVVIAVFGIHHLDIHQCPTRTSGAQDGLTLTFQISGRMGSTRQALPAWVASLKTILAS